MIDKNGVTVPDADRIINFSVKGVGNLAGTANGDIFSNEKWSGSNRSTYKGKCLIVLRSSQRKGQILIKAHAEGFPDKILRILAE